MGENIGGFLKEHLYALIYCGGGGTRLWPMSREDRPKQFLKIGSSKSLLRQTFDRLTPLISTQRIYAITLPEYTDEVREEIPELKDSQILVEPARRNTGLAAAYGVAAISKRDDQAVIANIWSDHLIKNPKEYRNAITAAAQTAFGENLLVTTGVHPDYPHTGLGYVKRGAYFDEIAGAGVFKVDKFTEKPKLQDAKRFVADGKYLWHVGLFVWTVETFSTSLAKHSPKLYRTMVKIKKAIGKPNQKSLVSRLYSSSETISIDNAVAEKETNFMVVEGSFDWIDVGDFSSLWDISRKDKDGNAVIKNDDGEVLLQESSESLVLSDGKRMVAVNGIKDLIVVSTENAVLVVPRQKSQKVKEIVNELRDEKKKEYL